MLLCELDIGGTIRRISDRELSLEHPWFAELAKAPTIKYASRRLHGGFVAPSFGDFSTVPDTFTETVWPPARSIVVTLYHTETTETEATQLLTGTGHLRQFARAPITYKLRKQAYGVTYKGTLNDTLVNLFTTYCGSGYLDRTLDATMARAVSPAINHTISSERPLVDVLSEAAACTCHGFYDDGTTLALYDCLADNGSLAIDEFDFLPATYVDGADYATFEAGDYAVDGTYSGGETYTVSPMYHANQATVEGYLEDIRTIMELQGVRFTLPICARSAVIKPGMRLSWTDASQGLPVTAWIRVQSLNWDFASHQLTIEGRGGIAA